MEWERGAEGCEGEESEGKMGRGREGEGGGRERGPWALFIRLRIPISHFVRLRTEIPCI